MGDVLLNDSAPVIGRAFREELFSSVMFEDRDGHKSAPYHRVLIAAMGCGTLVE